MSETTKGQPIPREPNPKLQFTNDIAVFPPGFKAPLDNRTTLEMMDDRDAEAASK